MSEPVTVSCPAACTVTLQVEITTPFFNMSLEDGAAIGFAIVAVWTIGVVFRALSRILKDDGVLSTNQGE